MLAAALGTYSRATGQGGGSQSLRHLWTLYAQRRKASGVMTQRFIRDTAIHPAQFNRSSFRRASKKRRHTFKFSD